MCACVSGGGGGFCLCVLLLLWLLVCACVWLTGLFVCLMFECCMRVHCLVLYGCFFLQFVLCYFLFSAVTL